MFKSPLSASGQKFSHFIAPIIFSVATLTATSAFAADQASWQRAVVSVVSSNQSYPHQAEARHEQGTTKVRLSLDASGAISKVEIVASSGSDILDKETEKMFKRIGSLPAPPAGITALVVPVAWRLD